MDEFTHIWTGRGRTVTFSWMGDTRVTASRVYALACTDDGRLLLVTDDPDGAGFWLPGGGIEQGETPEEALIRELAEEAAATILEMRRIGAQRVEEEGRPEEFHDFYWCRVRLADAFFPEHEVNERRLVAPEVFLHTLFWGRQDAKAAMLLERALEIDRLYSEME